MQRSSFWKELSPPFFVLAPMADVTDIAFRTMFARYGKPDVFWTEFVSADGLLSPGREILKHDLAFTEQQRPIVAQLFTSSPESMYKAGMLVASLGFDGIDINMGCPDRSVEKQGSGAALIRTPEKAREVIEAAKRTGLPVSVKTRLGYAKQEWKEWIPIVLSTGIEALTIHLRTRKELSKVPAHWEVFPEIVQLRNTLSPETRIIGNGDIPSLALARQKAKETQCDGIMIGRGIFGNPKCFTGETTESMTPQEKLTLLVEHAQLFSQLLPMKNFSIMKKHFKAYVQGFEGAKELRTTLMESAEHANDVTRIVEKVIKTL